MSSENDSYSSQFDLKTLQIATEHTDHINSYFKLKYKIFHTLRSVPPQTITFYFSSTVKINEYFFYFIFTTVFNIAYILILSLFVSYIWIYLLLHYKFE